MTRRTRTIGVTLGVALVATLAAGCGPTITAPDVVGMRLDAAHREFETLEVSNFDDQDVIGEEDFIGLDANWVVIEQNPPAGATEIDTDTTIDLMVGNEDDPEVLEAIPAESPFALEVNPPEDPEPTPSANPEPEPENAPSETPDATPGPGPSATEASENDPAVLCARKQGNPGEIYAWNSYGSDQPPDAIRLGDGYVWLFGDKRCVTSTEFALTINPGLPGYCTEVGNVSQNPGYAVNARPAPRLPNIQGQAGDC